MKERFKTALIAASVGAVVGAVAGLVLMKESFPFYVLLGFTTTFGVIGFCAKKKWREAISNWFLELFDPF